MIDPVILLFVPCLAEPALPEEGARFLLCSDSALTVMIEGNAWIQHVLSLNQLIVIYGKTS